MGGAWKYSSGCLDVLGSLNSFQWVRGIDVACSSGRFHQFSRQARMLLRSGLCWFSSCANSIDKDFFAMLAGALMAFDNGISLGIEAYLNFSMEKGPRRCFGVSGLTLSTTPDGTSLTISGLGGASRGAALALHSASG